MHVALQNPKMGYLSKYLIHVKFGILTNSISSMTCTQRTLDYEPDGYSCLNSVRTPVQVEVRAKWVGVMQTLKAGSRIL